MIEKFTSKISRNVRGTRVATGDTLYAIRKGDLYFIWCYTDRDLAIYIDNKASPGDRADIAANWRRSLRELIPTNRKITEL